MSIYIFWRLSLFLEHCSHTLLSRTQITQKYFTQVKSVAGKKEMLDEFAINSLIYNFYKNLMTNSLKAGQPAMITTSTN